MWFTISGVLLGNLCVILAGRFYRRSLTRTLNWSDIFPTHRTSCSIQYPRPQSPVRMLRRNNHRFSTQWSHWRCPRRGPLGRFRVEDAAWKSSDPYGWTPARTPINITYYYRRCRNNENTQSTHTSRRTLFFDNNCKLKSASYNISPIRISLLSKFHK